MSTLRQTWKKVSKKGKPDGQLQIYSEVDLPYGNLKVTA